MATVAITTLGCKVNQFESEALMSALEERGYQLVPFEAGADIAIINTCTVTHRADFQSRQMVRRALRFNPRCLTIITGCYAQVDPEAVSKIEPGTYVLGNVEKYQIPDLLPLMEKGRFPSLQVGAIEGQSTFLDTNLHHFRHHTRALLKIQEGCDARCAYCIVPRARGRSRSLPPERVLRHARVLRENGYQEVVLTGIHLGSYGLDLLPPFPLVELLKRLEEEETPPRIRLSSIEPMDFSEELIRFLSTTKKVCPHLHIPIQSGDDQILKWMNRGYSRSFLFDLIETLHRTVPELSIGTDVIVGFPGETEEQFQHTYELIQLLPFSYLHVFPFSRRKGALVDRSLRAVDHTTLSRRAQAMRELGRRKRQTFYSKFLHRPLWVLVEGQRERPIERWKGFSRNYIPVWLPLEGPSAEGSNWVNREWMVEATQCTEMGLLGQVLEQSRG